MNRLRHTFTHSLEKHGITQSDFALRAEVTHSAITKFLQGTTPRADLFKKIFCNWPDDETKRSLLRAHIVDEIERTGLKPSDFETRLAFDDTIEQDIQTIERAMKTEPTLREFIRKTAEMFREEKTSRTEAKTKSRQKKGEIRPVET